ncbi:hypothetical protein ANO14919_068930 [Xylariales sp. No.14919]|nr:hypothetical protein ANO14919_068930 [Xylariales sp. No.14919]
MGLEWSNTASRPPADQLLGHTNPAGTTRLDGDDWSPSNPGPVPGTVDHIPYALVGTELIATFPIRSRAGTGTYPHPPAPAQVGQAVAPDAKVIEVSLPLPPCGSRGQEPPASRRE